MNALAQMTLVQRLRNELARGTADLPMLPRSADSVLRIAQRADVDFAEVARVIEGDPPLCARLLAVANSALYARGIAITSVFGAAVRLGAQALRDLLFMSVYSASVFDVPSYRSLVERTFSHGVVVGRTARRMSDGGERPAGRPSAPDPDKDDTAFLAGLLHDLGRARCLKIVAKLGLRPGADELEAALAECHSVAGGALARAWRLPQAIVEACEYHHAPGQRPMARLIAAADEVAKAALEEAGQRELVRRALAAVGVDPSRADLLVAAARFDSEALGLSS